MKFRALTFAIVLAGCGYGTSAEKSPGFFENLSGRNEMVVRSPSVYIDPTDAMPTVEYFGKGIEAFTVSDLYIRGSVVSVEPGIGMSWTIGGNGEVIRQLEFGSPDAQVNTVHLVIAPTKVVGPNGSSEGGGDLTVGVALSGAVNLAAIRSELVSENEFAMILVDSNPVFSYSPGLKSILDDGNYIGRVENGNINFMVLGAHEGSVPSVPLSLIESQGKRRISVHRDNGVLVQE